MLQNYEPHLSELKERVTFFSHDEINGYQSMGTFWACVRLVENRCAFFGEHRIIKPENIYQVIFRKNCIKGPRLGSIQRIDWNCKELSVLSLSQFHVHWTIGLVCQK